MKVYFFAILSLIILGMLSSCKTTSSDNSEISAGIRGKYVYEDGEASYGAIVTLIPIEVMDTTLASKKKSLPIIIELPTDTASLDGEFWFDDLLPGIYNVAATGAQVDSNGDTSSIAGSIQTDIIVNKKTLNNIGIDTLKGLGNAIISVISDGNENLEGITCTLKEIGQSALTDTRGNCSFANLPQGDYTVEFDHDTYNIDPQGNITVNENDTTKIISPLDTADVPPDTTINVKDTVMLFLGVEGSGGSVSPQSAQIEKGDSILIEATPDNGYVFAKWVASGTVIVSDPLSAKTMITISASDTINAHFEKLNRLILSIIGKGRIATNNDTLGSDDTSFVKRDSLLILSAIQDSGWIFNSWQGIDSGADSTAVQVTVTSDTSISVKFDSIIMPPTPDSVNIKLSKSNGGSVVVISGTDTVFNGEGSIKTDSNTSIDIEANPDSGWFFGLWKIVSGTIEIQDSSNSTTQIKGKSDSSEISAKFIQYANLSLGFRGQGTVTGTEGMLIPDSAYDIEAVAGEHYKFVRWEVDSGRGVFEDSSQSKTTVSLSEGASITVRGVFEIIQHQLTIVVNSTEGSLVAPIDSVIMVDRNTAINIEVSINSNFRFSNWTLTGDSGIISDPSAAKTQITLFSDVTLNANFQGRYILTVVSGGNGGVSPSSAGGYEGDDIPITATPDTFYQFENWTITSGTANITNNNNSSTTLSLTSDATVRANFSRKKAILTLQVQGATKDTAMLQPSDPTEVNQGDTTQISTAQDTSRYTFSHWRTDSGMVTILDSASNSTGVILSGSASLTAIYSLKNYELTVLPSVGGSTDPNGTTNVNPAAPTVQIQARINAADTQFVMWKLLTGIGQFQDSSALTTQLTISSDATIQAVFAPILDTLFLVSSSANYSPTPDTSIVPRGTVIKISANPVAPQNRVNWTTKLGSVIFTDGTSKFDDSAHVVIDPPQPNSPPVSATLSPFPGN